MVLVFTGDGKGKTTAALGQAARAVGRGKNALRVQFIKGPWKAGEDAVEMRRKGDGGGKFELRKMGLGFVGILGDTLPREEHKKAAEEALLFAEQEIKKGEWDVVILDEVNVAVSLGLISSGEVLRVLTDLPEERLVLLTGRGAPKEFIDRADLVTGMKEIKHPFQEGNMGKPMVEF